MLGLEPQSGSGFFFKATVDSDKSINTNIQKNKSFKQ